MHTDNRLHLTYREYKFPEKFPFLIMQVSSISPKIDFIHFHNCIEIALIEKGNMLWNFENKENSVSSGNICLIPPFFTHASYFPPQDTSDVLCHYLFFDPELLFAPLYPHGLPSQFLWYHHTDFSKLLPGNVYWEEKNILQLIMKEYSEQKPHYNSIIVGLIENLMVQLCRHHVDTPVLSPRRNNIPILFPALSLIDREYNSQINMSHLAHLCSLSEKQFLEMFKNNIRRTPLQYQREVRISKACNLLISTEMTVLDIALQTGFSSLSSFYRAFRQLMGCSPQAYRSEKCAIVKKNIVHSLYQADC